jgi:hypothetical protein
LSSLSSIAVKAPIESTIFSIVLAISFLLYF